MNNPINRITACLPKCPKIVPEPTVYTKLELAEYTGKNENSANNKMKAQSGLSPLKYFCTMLDIGWFSYYNLRTFSLN